MLLFVQKGLKYLGVRITIGSKIVCELVLLSIISLAVIFIV